MNLLRKILRTILPTGVIKILIEYFWTRTDLRKKYRKAFVGDPLHLQPDNLILEENTKLHDDVMIISHKGKVVIKKYSAVAARACFIPGTHTPTVGIPQCLSGLHINDRHSVITVEEDCWIGANTIFLSRAHIGRGAVVGAGAIVTGYIPPYAVVAGVPAKILAVKFSIDQILEHEKVLYSIDERIPRIELEEIFKQHYIGLRSIGTSDISDEDIKILENKMEDIGLSILRHDK